MSQRDDIRTTALQHDWQTDLRAREDTFYRGAITITVWYHRDVVDQAVMWSRTGITLDRAQHSVDVIEWLAEGRSPDAATEVRSTEAVAE